MTDIIPSPTSPAPVPAPSADAADPPAPAEASPGEAPPSRVTFDVLSLSREVREALAEMGYVHPTPVQIAVWEPATRGKDAVVQARTGTGKTAAFGLPIVDHLVRRSMPQVQVLALCPTRELALQVAAEIERIGKKRNVKVAAIYGGAPMGRQIDQIADGAQVVVGTPGRVLDHLRRGTLDPRHVRMLVLDESDEMLSMGFEREVTAILDTLPKDRQTLLFSATLPPDIERMAKKLRAPEFITLSGDHIGALEIEHFVYMVAGDKLGALARVIEVENPESAVIFCNTKDETERVAQTLSRQGFDADWLNGDLPQSDREKVMAATREGRLRFLVATDVAARGIDISHLTHVINYDFPQDAESYVHRTGRTGRAGRTGTAIALITPHDVGGLYLLRLTYKIRPIERQIPTEGELKTRAEADLVTLLVEAFAKDTVHPDDLSLARRLLTHEQCDVIFAGLLRDHLGARPTAKEEAGSARRATRAPVTTGSPVGAPSPPPKPTARAAPPAPAPAPVPVPVPERPPPMPKPEERRAEERRSRDDHRERRAPRPEGQAPRRPRREEHIPVSAAEGTHEGSSDPRQVPQRHADFSTWQPPEEEGDDEPILGHDTLHDGSHDGGHDGGHDARPRREPRDRDRPRRAPFQEPPRAAPAAAEPAANPPAEPEPEGDLAEIYVNVGRRDGARAADFQQILTERAGIERAHVRRIRVRERNAFVSVRGADLPRALAALNGATVAGKTAMAEQARERSAEAEPAPQAPTDPAAFSMGSPAGAPVSTGSPIGAPIEAEPAPDPTSDDSVPTSRGQGQG